MAVLGLGERAIRCGRWRRHRPSWPVFLRASKRRLESQAALNASLHTWAIEYAATLGHSRRKRKFSLWEFAITVESECQL